MSGSRDEKLEYTGVVRPLLRYLNSLPNSKAVNIHGSVFCERGTPDVIGSIQGRTVAFECKRDTTEDLEDIQKWRLCEWIAAGAVVGGVSSVEQADLILRLMGLVE